MRGRYLLLISGILLSLGSSSEPSRASFSIAQRPVSARVVTLPSARWPTTPPKRNRIALLTPPSTSRPYLAVVDQPDIRDEHKRIADEVLRLLPPKCLKQIRDFYVRYEKPERRGLAGKSVVIMDGTLPAEEFRAVLIHELGHVVDLGCVVGTPKAAASAFRDGDEVIRADDPSVRFYAISWETSTKRRGGVKPQDFVTGYAMTDPFEDLAESTAYFVLHHEAFAERARRNPILAAKMQWIEEWIYPSFTSVSTGTAWDGSFPWDATKLPYTWEG